MPAALSAGGQTLSGEAFWPLDETEMAWGRHGLVVELLDQSSDVGDKQNPITPELHKHIYLQVRLNFFFRVLYESLL